MIATKQTVADILKERKFDPKKPRPQNQVVISIREKKVAVNASYCVFTGLPKAGKSSFISALIGSAFIMNPVLNLKINLAKDKRLGYFDTESSPFDFYNNMERIKYFSNNFGYPRQLDAFNVREDSPTMIKSFINEYMKDGKCQVLVIDGLLDLVHSFNDETEAKKLTQWFKKITKVYDCVIVTVLHLGKKDLNSLGHVGSTMDRYANSVLEVTKDKELGVYTLSSKFMRSDEDFEPVHIKRYGDGFMEVDHTPRIVEPKKKPPRN